MGCTCFSFPISFPISVVLNAHSMSTELQVLQYGHCYRSNRMVTGGPSSELRIEEWSQAAWGNQVSLHNSLQQSTGGQG